MSEHIHDMIIIGGGPAGLAAGLYASRGRLDALVIEKGLIGGQINNTDIIENYPGFPGGISASELVEKFEAHAKDFDVNIVMEDVSGVCLDGDIKVIETGKNTYRSKTLIITTGSVPNKLGVEGEEEYQAKGVSYCATCDGAFFEDVPVAVIGGGDSAVEEGLFLTRFASEVRVIHRRDELRAVKYLQDKAFANSKIKFEWDSVLDRIDGNGTAVKSIAVKNVKSGEISKLEVEGVFIYVGLNPLSDFVKDLVKTEEGGYIVVDSNQETSIPGIYAAGDVANKLYRQIGIAAGEGARAELAAEKYLVEH